VKPDLAAFVEPTMCLSDKQCVSDCLDGRSGAFRHLVDRYQAPLTKHLAGRLGNENEVTEAAQETMVRAFFALRTLRKPESFYSWLLGIADRVAKEAYRARGREIALIDAEAASGDVGTPAPHEACSASMLSQAVAELPEAQRQVVMLRFYSGLSCSEIARNLELPLGTITSRLSRAYASLRIALQGSLLPMHDMELES